MAGVDATQTGTKLFQPNFDFTSLVVSFGAFPDCLDDPLPISPFRFDRRDLYRDSRFSLSSPDFQVRSFVPFRMINRSFHLISFQANRITQDR